MIKDYKRREKIQMKKKRMMGTEREESKGATTDKERLLS